MFGKLLTIIGVVAGAVAVASAATADFCFGWNVQNCQTVTQPSIPLLNAGPVSVNCDNCYFEVSGKLALDLEPFTIGIENMVINLVGEVDAQAVGTWSFEKQESPILASVTILHEPLPVTLQVPLVIDFRGSFNGNAQGKIGIQAVGNIGSWESIHKDGHWQHIYPTPTWEVTHIMGFAAGVTGDVDFIVNPQVNIQVGDIFKGSLNIDQNADVNLQLTTSPSREYVGGDLECTVCNFFINQIEQLISLNKSLTEIENILSDVCTHLTGSWETVCQTIVHSDIPLIIKYIEDQLPSSVICTTLGLCPSSIVEIEIDAKCSLCDMIVGQVETLIASDVVEQKIEGVLFGICLHLITPMSKTCMDVVSTYLPAIIRFIEHKYPPSTICSKIGLCPTVLSSHVYKIEPVKTSPSFCATFTEDFKIDWMGELKIPLLHIDKTFDISLMDWKRTIPYGNGC